MKLIWKTLSLLLVMALIMGCSVSVPKLAFLAMPTSNAAADSGAIDGCDRRSQIQSSQHSFHSYR